MKSLSVEVACLLGIQKEIQAVCMSTIWHQSKGRFSCCVMATRRNCWSLHKGANSRTVLWNTVDKGLCVLLSECIQLKPIAETISGQSKCGGVDQCEITGRCVGKLVDVSYTETPQSCSSICQSIPGCLWYTHDSSTKGCYSLKDCIPVFDCPTCISGEVNCPSEEGIHQITIWSNCFIHP